MHLKNSAHQGRASEPLLTKLFRNPVKAIAHFHRCSERRLHRIVKTSVASAFLATLMLASPSVNAAIEPEISIGSAGLGVGTTFPLNQRNDFRLEYDFSDGGGYELNTYTSETLNGGIGQPPVVAQMTFHDTFHAHHFSVFFDHHLNNGPVYLSAGLDINNNRLDAISQNDQSNFQINNNTLGGAQVGTVAVHVRWNPLVPYLGIGFQSQAHDIGKSSGKPRLDLGVLVQGKRRITVETSAFVAANPALFGAYVQAFTDRVPSHVPLLNLYPIVRMTLPIGH